MGKDTDISWTLSTANESFGCRKVDAACQNCYMFRLRERWGEKGTDIKRFSIDKLAARIRGWPKEKNLVFLDDMTDLFGEFNGDARIEETHVKIIEGNPNREFQLLTKRIGRAMVFYRNRAKGVPKNVWIGCSIGERARLKRLTQLVQIPAKVRYISFEPLLEDLGEFSLKGVQWAIVGGESGVNPRPMKPEWAESIRSICERDGVAFYFKQMGGKGGGGAGGDVLNGKTYHNFPVI